MHLLQCNKSQNFDSKWYFDIIIANNNDNSLDLCRTLVALE